jgi:tetratricopeptide (TPR) repeat protein
VRRITCGGFAAARNAALTAALLAASAAQAGAPEDGLRLAAEGRCAESLPLLAEAPADSFEAKRARALCLLQEADYAEAALALAQLERAEPALATDLGIALFHSGDLERAEAALRRAEEQGNPRAEVPLYLGLIALGRERTAEASAQLERAQRVAPEALAPAAAYYAGLARARSGDREAARAALAQVVSTWPGTPWAEEAARASTTLDGPHSLFAGLRLGFEHDSNAVLRGQGVDLPAEIPSQADQRFVWQGAAGRTWQVSRSAQVGSTLAFSGSAYGDLTSFDVLHPALTVWGDQRLGERTTLRALAGYSHAWVGGDSFLSAPSLGLELVRDSAARGVTRVFAELAFDDYLFESTDPPALARARDRDGLGVRVGAEHSLPLPALATRITGALAYRRFSADGTEYSFDSPELALGVESALPAKFQVAAGVRYAYRHYRNPTTYAAPGTERVEHDWGTELSIWRPIWRQLGLGARWRYQRNHSTADVFDYSRHIAGLYASWTLNP